MIKLSTLKAHKKNPRKISEEKLDKLKASIEGFKKMMSIRKIIVDEKNVILSGNQRFLALKSLGYKEVPDDRIDKVMDLSTEEKKEFLLKDNDHDGDWDKDLFDDKFWDTEDVGKWMGEDFLDSIDAGDGKDEGAYTQKVEAPIYKPEYYKPDHAELYDLEKTEKLLAKIEKAKIPEEDKEFLRQAAQRHCVFNYHKIADFYAHSNKKVQGLMEDSALVIIDFKKAIELGYVRLSDNIAKQYIEDYGDEK